MVLKPLDLVVLLKIAALDDKRWTQKLIASELSVSVSDINESIKRCKHARLLDELDLKLKRRSLEEFVIHGAKYAFPAEVGGPTIGLPTAFAAPPLATRISWSGPPPVWPDMDGPETGFALLPLHRSAVFASRRDSRLYEFLALVDALRYGRAREVAIAKDEITARIRGTACLTT
jgi:hypothetical protein